MLKNTLPFHKNTTAVVPLVNSQNDKTSWSWVNGGLLFTSLILKEMYNSQAV